jgi:SAM-dependent methyltransferase
MNMPINFASLTPSTALVDAPASPLLMASSGAAFKPTLSNGKPTYIGLPPNGAINWELGTAGTKTVLKGPGGTLYEVPPGPVMGGRDAIRAWAVKAYGRGEMNDCNVKFTAGGALSPSRTNSGNIFLKKQSNNNPFSNPSGTNTTPLFDLSADSVSSSARPSGILTDAEKEAGMRKAVNGWFTRLHSAHAQFLGDPRTREQFGNELAAIHRNLEKTGWTHKLTPAQVAALKKADYDYAPLGRTKAQMFRTTLTGRNGQKIYVKAEVLIKESLTSDGMSWYVTKAEITRLYYDDMSDNGREHNKILKNPVDVSKGVGYYGHWLGEPLKTIPAVMEVVHDRMKSQFFYLYNEGKTPIEQYRAATDAANIPKAVLNGMSKGLLDFLKGFVDIATVPLAAFGELVNVLAASANLNDGKILIPAAHKFCVEFSQSLAQLSAFMMEHGTELPGLAGQAFVRELKTIEQMMAAGNVSGAVEKMSQAAANLALTLLTLKGILRQTAGLLNALKTGAQDARLALGQFRSLPADVQGLLRPGSNSFRLRPGQAGGLMPTRPPQRTPEPPSPPKSEPLPGPGPRVWGAPTQPKPTGSIEVSKPKPPLVPGQDPLPKPNPNPDDRIPFRAPKPTVPPSPQAQPKLPSSQMRKEGDLPKPPNAPEVRAAVLPGAEPTVTSMQRLRYLEQLIQTAKARHSEGLPIDKEAIKTAWQALFDSVKRPGHKLSPAQKEPFREYANWVEWATGGVEGSPRGIADKRAAPQPNSKPVPPAAGLGGPGGSAQPNALTSPLPGANAPPPLRAPDIAAPVVPPTPPTRPGARPPSTETVKPPRTPIATFPVKSPLAAPPSGTQSPQIAPFPESQATPIRPKPISSPTLTDDIGTWNQENRTREFAFTKPGLPGQPPHELTTNSAFDATRLQGQGWVYEGLIKLDPPRWNEGYTLVKTDPSGVPIRVTVLDKKSAERLSAQEGFKYETRGIKTVYPKVQPDGTLGPALLAPSPGNGLLPATDNALVAGQTYRVLVETVPGHPARVVVIPEAQAFSNELGRPLTDTELVGRYPQLAKEPYFKEGVRLWPPHAAMSGGKLTVAQDGTMRFEPVSKLNRSAVFPGTTELRTPSSERLPGGDARAIADIIEQASGKKTTVVAAPSASPWSEYYEIIKDSQPAMQLISTLLHAARSGRPPGLAVDLGAGAGLQTAALAGAGWSVIAVDADPASLAYVRRSLDQTANRIKRRGEDPTNIMGQVVTVSTTFANFRFPLDGTTDLVYSGSLSFVSRAEVQQVIDHARASLKPGGQLIISLFGQGHALKDKPGISTWTEVDVIELLKDFEIVNLAHNVQTTKFSDGAARTLDLIEVTARKRENVRVQSIEGIPSPRRVEGGSISGKSSASNTIPLLSTADSDVQTLRDLQRAQQYQGVKAQKNSNGNTPQEQPQQGPVRDANRKPPEPAESVQPKSSNTPPDALGSDDVPRQLKTLTPLELEIFERLFDGETLPDIKADMPALEGMNPVEFESLLSGITDKLKVQTLTNAVNKATRENWYTDGRNLIDDIQGRMSDPARDRLAVLQADPELQARGLAGKNSLRTLSILAEWTVDFSSVDTARRLGLQSREVEYALEVARQKLGVLGQDFALQKAMVDKLKIDFKSPDTAMQRATLEQLTPSARVIHQLLVQHMEGYAALQPFQQALIAQWVALAYRPSRAQAQFGIDKLTDVSDELGKAYRVLHPESGTLRHGEDTRFLKAATEQALASGMANGGVRMSPADVQAQIKINEQLDTRFSDVYARLSDKAKQNYALLAAHLTGQLQSDKTWTPRDMAILAQVAADGFNLANAERSLGYPPRSGIVNNVMNKLRKTAQGKNLESWLPAVLEKGTADLPVVAAPIEAPSGSPIVSVGIPSISKPEPRDLQQAQGDAQKKFGGGTPQVQEQPQQGPGPLRSPKSAIDFNGQPAGTTASEEPPLTLNQANRQVAKHESTVYEVLYGKESAAAHLSEADKLKRQKIVQSVTRWALAGFRVENVADLWGQESYEVYQHLKAARNANSWRLKEDPDKSYDSLAKRLDAATGLPVPKSVLARVPVSLVNADMFVAQYQGQVYALLYGEPSAQMPLTDAKRARQEAIALTVTRWMATGFVGNDVSRLWGTPHQTVLRYLGVAGQLGKAKAGLSADLNYKDQAVQRWLTESLGLPPTGPTLPAGNATGSVSLKPVDRAVTPALPPKPSVQLDQAKVPQTLTPVQQKLADENNLKMSAVKPTGGDAGLNGSAERSVVLMETEFQNKFQIVETVHPLDPKSGYVITIKSLPGEPPVIAFRPGHGAKVGGVQVSFAAPQRERPRRDLKKYAFPESRVNSLDINVVHQSSLSAFAGGYVEFESDGSVTLTTKSRAHNRFVERVGNLKFPRNDNIDDLTLHQLNGAPARKLAQLIADATGWSVRLGDPVFKGSGELVRPTSRAPDAKISGIDAAPPSETPSPLEQLRQDQQTQQAKQAQIQQQFGGNVSQPTQQPQQGVQGGGPTLVRAIEASPVLRERLMALEREGFRVQQNPLDAQGRTLSGLYLRDPEDRLLQMVSPAQLSELARMLRPSEISSAFERFFSPEAVEAALSKAPVSAMMVKPSAQQWIHQEFNDPKHMKVVTDAAGNERIELISNAMHPVSRKAYSDLQSALGPATVQRLIDAFFFGDRGQGPNGLLGISTAWRAERGMEKLNDNTLGKLSISIINSTEKPTVHDLEHLVFGRGVSQTTEQLLFMLGSGGFKHQAMVDGMMKADLNSLHENKSFDQLVRTRTEDISSLDSKNFVGTVAKPKTVLDSLKINPILSKINSNLVPRQIHNLLKEQGFFTYLHADEIKKIDRLIFGDKNQGIHPLKGSLEKDGARFDQIHEIIKKASNRSVPASSSDQRDLIAREIAFKWMLGTRGFEFSNIELANPRSPLFYWEAISKHLGLSRVDFATEYPAAYQKVRAAVDRVLDGQSP